MTKPETALSKNLKKLISHKNMTITELARQVDVGQPVLFRIMNSEIASPKVSTVAKIAAHFGISIDQMAGYQPMPPSLDNHSGWKAVPLLTLADLGKGKKTKTENFVYTEAGHNNADCFAIQVEGNAMLPLFPTGTTIIINTALEPKDNDYVIAKIKGEETAHFKQLETDGSNAYLRPLNEKFDAVKISKSDCKILGVAIQSKIDLKD